MALDISLKRSATETAVEKPTRARAASGPWGTIRGILMPLASLKFTIVLFALSIFIVFAGTLAQKQLDIWQVIHGWFRVDLRYLFTSDFPFLNLREMFVRIPLNIFCIDMFFPESVWKNGPPETDLGIWFPRGWLIGVLMGINLLAAHTVRFSIQAKGTRLWAGLGVIVLGCLATWAAVESGSSEAGVLEGASIEWSLLWKLMLLGLTAMTFGAGAAAFLLEKHRVVERVTAALTAVICGALLLYGIVMLITRGEMLIKPEGMRILWQLIKGGGAGVVLLIGCWMVFKKRAGIVLLHSGIGLIFLYELIVGMWHEEAQMPIFEGTRSNWVHDIRSIELALIQEGATQDEVLVVPQRFLDVSDKPIDNEKLKDLPFTIKVVEYYRNSKLREKGPFEPTKATQGHGLEFMAEKADPVTGTDSDGTVDTPSMFIELTKKSGESMGTYLVGLDLTSLAWQSPQFPRETVEVDGKKYIIELRAKRTYKPYVIEALEVKQDKYVGGEKTKSYSSNVHVKDDALNVDREELIRMNSPMRFAGETFYQSGYAETPVGKMTTLSVVENAGWMLPYVACMIVGVGMLAQFGIVLLRFLGRAQTATTADALPGTESLATAEPLAERMDAAGGKRNKKNKGSFAPVPQVAAVPERSFWNRYGTMVTVLLCVAAFQLYLAKPPKVAQDDWNFAAFGKLPVAYESRVKPMDALARNALTHLLDKQSFKTDYKDKKAKSQPAAKWLLDVAVGDPKARDYQVFRIENDELPKALDLPEQPNLSYSFNQILAKKRAGTEAPNGEPMPELLVQLEKVRERAEKRAKGRQPDAWDREVVKLYERLSIFNEFGRAFHDAGRDLPAKVEHPKGETEHDKAVDSLIALAPVASRLAELDLVGRKPPMPVILVDGTWTTVAEATLLRYLEDPSRAEEIAIVDKRIGEELAQLKLSFEEMESVIKQVGRGRQLPPEIEERRGALRLMVAGTEKMKKLLETHRDPGKHLGPRGNKFLSILDAYRAEDIGAFNAAVAEYREMIVANPPQDYDVSRRDWETFLVRSEPFFWNAWMYLIAFCFAATAWLGFRKQLNAISFWLIVGTFVAHTAALTLRIYVTERPPVTNLYSSAVFIGWAGALFGLILEAVYRNGFGNIVASVAGFVSLLIAWLLSRQGDTIEALEAVLDTTFWLTTHVTCITLGYATTYIAGLLGVAYVAYGVATPRMTQSDSKMIARMIYGILCFALFFSFIGTVLGGLWADDSWGRFWGWDPKENGALIIVLWNALILHARWDGMVKDRGLAILAVVGNITTSWSWFGVNQLGIGKHNYGFNQQLMNLMIGIVVSSLAVAAVGLLPRKSWWSGANLTEAK